GLGIGGTKDAALSNDGSDVLVGCDVKGRIADSHAVGCELRAGVVCDFSRGALFNGNGFTVRRSEVDGGPRGGDVERDAVLAGEDSDVVGADFVGHVAIGRDAVGSDDDGLNFSFAHETGGHVVADDGGGNVVGHQFPGGE